MYSTAPSSPIVDSDGDLDDESFSFQLPGSSGVASVDGHREIDLGEVEDSFSISTSTDTHGSVVESAGKDDSRVDSGSESRSESENESENESKNENDNDDESDCQAAAVALPDSDTSGLMSSLSNISVASFHDEASAISLPESSLPTPSASSSLDSTCNNSLDVNDASTINGEDGSGALILHSDTLCETAEDSCRVDGAKGSYSYNASTEVWRMPNEDDEKEDYLNRFFKHHFLSYDADNKTWVLDQSKYPEPVVLHSVTKHGQVFSKSEQVPGLKACSAGVGDESVVVVGWDNLAVWHRASEVKVASFSKSSGLYVLETARKFEFSMYSHLASVRQKKPTQDLKHFHGFYLVHCGRARKGSGNHSVKDWVIGGDIQTVMSMDIGEGPVPGLLAGTLKFAGVEWTLLMARQSIMIKAYLEGTDWKTIPIIDYGTNYRHLSYRMNNSSGEESTGSFHFDSYSFTSFWGEGSFPGTFGTTVTLQGFES